MTRLSHFATRTLALAHKETLHAVRDQYVVYLSLVMPVVLVVLFGYAVTFDMEEVPIAVVDRDSSAASRRLVSALEASDAFSVAEQLTRERLVDQRFRRGAIKVAVVIPRGYARSLLRGEATQLQLLVDGADGTTARIAVGYARGIAQSETVGQLQQAAGDVQPLAARVRTLFNPRMESALFVVPGLVALILAVLSVLLSTITVAREWERGSMEQLFSTPVGRLAVVLGKLLPYVALGVLQMLLVLVAGCWLFEVPIRGSFALLLFATTLFLVCVLGQGLLISLATRNQQVATQIGLISSLLPSLLLSGFIFPIENMPALLRGISYVVPARYMMACLRGLMLQGCGVEVLWPQLLGLAALALAVVAVCTVRFRRRLD